MKYWHHKTTSGTFYIIQHQNVYDIMFHSNHFGTYDDPQQALDALLGGHTTLPLTYDPKTLGIPKKLEEWHQDQSNINYTL